MSGAEQTEAVGLGNMPELIAFFVFIFQKTFYFRNFHIFFIIFFPRHVDN